jgi:cysteine synthase
MHRCVFITDILIFLGVPVNHKMAKEALMGLVGAEMDKWAETKGMDKVDKERAKHQAEEQADHFYNNQYGDQDQFNP